LDVKKKRGEKKKTMKIITINLPEKYLAALQILQDLGIYPSRSESIRVALGDFLAGDLKMVKDLKPETFKILIRSGGDRN